MIKRVSLVVVVVLLMASPAYATFYGYWLNKWDAPKYGVTPPVGYTNSEQVCKGVSDDDIAEILGRGQHLRLVSNWNWPTPLDAFPSRENGAKISRYRFSRYNDAGLVTMMYLAYSPYEVHYGWGSLDPFMARAYVDAWVDIYKRNMPGYKMAMSFAANDLSSPVFTQGVPTGLDFAGLNHHPFSPTVGVTNETEFNANFSAVLTAFRGVNDEGAEMFLIGQGFDCDEVDCTGYGFDTPPTQSPHWYKNWVQSESDIAGLVWYKWPAWSYVSDSVLSMRRPGLPLAGKGSNTMALLLAQQQQVGLDLGMSASPTPIAVPAKAYEGLIDRWTFNTDRHSDGSIGLLSTFEGGSPPVVRDTPGGGNNGYEFNGSTNRLHMVTSNRYGVFTMDEVTVEAWFKVSDAGGMFKTIFSKKVDELWFGIKGTKVVGSMSGLESGDILYDTWYHAAYVIEGTESFNEEKLYLNGVLVASRPSEWTGIVDDNPDVYIGYVKTGLGHPFHGIIDEVRVHDVALSGAAILDSYNDGPTTAAPAIKVTESNGSTDVSETDGLPDTYTVELLHSASDDVTINLTFDNAQIDVSPASLTWDIQADPANWQNVKVVTVTADADAVLEGNHASIITQTAVSNDPIFNDPIVYDPNNNDPNHVVRNVAVNITEAPYCGDGNHALLTGDVSGPAGQPDCYLNLYDFVAISEDWFDCTDPANVLCP
jgi:hypothetical protein